MPDRPTLHLTNWSSTKLHGPGRKLTIMAAPRRWEHGEGRVDVLCPNRLDLHEIQRGLITLADYRERCEQRMGAYPDRLAPGGLAWFHCHTQDAGLVADGDTLCCACSREEAAAGRCHRAWAAPYLVQAGWRVLLDGVEVPSV